MTNSMRRVPVAFLVSAALAALPACSTEEIGHETVRPQTTQTSPNQGALMIVSAPTPENIEFRDGQNLGFHSTFYEVLIDEKLLVIDSGEWLFTTVGEARLTKVGFLAAGTHRFRMAVEQGGPVVFEGDVTMPAGAVTRLCLFGPRAALQSVVVSYPLAPPSDSKHVNVVNMLIDDVDIEVVRCDDATHCTPLSRRLAAGDSFDATFPLTVSDDQLSSLSARGAGIAWRQIATAALPSPALVPLSLDAWIADAPTSVNFAAAPMYLMADGTPLFSSN
jgi:hypothetical protein